MAVFAGVTDISYPGETKLAYLTSLNNRLRKVSEMTFRYFLVCVINMNKIPFRPISADKADTMNSDGDSTALTSHPDVRM